MKRSGQARLVYVIETLTVTSPPLEGEPAGTPGKVKLKVINMLVEF